MPELRPPGLVSSLFAGAGPFTAKIDDHLCLQSHRFDGSNSAQQRRSNCDTVSDIAEDLAPDSKLQSFPKGVAEVKEDPGFRMRDKTTWTGYREPPMSENNDTDVSHRWRPSQGCSTSHQPSLIVDPGHRLPTSFRRRNFIFNDGSTVSGNLTTTCHVGEQAYGLWLCLIQQLWSERNVSKSTQICLQDARQDFPSNGIECSTLRSVVHTLPAISEFPTSQSVTFPYHGHDPTSGSSPAFRIHLYVTGLPGRLSIFNSWFMYSSHVAEADDPPSAPPPEPSPTPTDQ